MVFVWCGYLRLKRYEILYLSSQMFRFLSSKCGSKADGCRKGLKKHTMETMDVRNTLFETFSSVLCVHCIKIKKFEAGLKLYPAHCVKQ